MQNKMRSIAYYIMHSILSGSYLSVVHKIYAMGTFVNRDSVKSYAPPLHYFIDVFTLRFSSNFLVPHSFLILYTYQNVILLLLLKLYGVAKLFCISKGLMAVT